MTGNSQTSQTNALSHGHRMAQTSTCHTFGGNVQTLASHTLYCLDGEVLKSFRLKYVDDAANGHPDSVYFEYICVK